MKLSVEKKWGYIHVRGGRLVEVVHEHPVASKGQCVVAKRMKEEFEPPRSLPPTVMARAGDLAIEIVTQRGGHLLGYSFLTGAAIQINSYDKRADRFTDAVLRSAPLRPPPDEEATIPSSPPSDDYLAGLAKLMAAMKYDPDVDVYAFHAICSGRENAEGLATFLQQVRQLVPSDMTDEENESGASQRSHFLGLVRGGQSKKAPCYFLHFQPKKHASDFAATMFQHALCISSLDHAGGDGDGAKAEA